MTLACQCTGCPGRLTLPLQNLGPIPEPCDKPHISGMGRAAFASYETLVSELVRRRCQIGLAQADVDDAAGLTSGHVAKWESFAKVASPPSLLLWAQTLGLQITTAPAPLPAATIRAIDDRQAKPYRADQARFKIAG